MSPIKHSIESLRSLTKAMSFKKISSPMFGSVIIQFLFQRHP
nr:unnamed protein product [Callosobruchus chinensis]